MNKFFTYGTLMTGMSNHRVIPKKSIESIQAASIKDVELYAIQGGHFPCLIEGNNEVIGELITIKDKHLEQAIKMMDRLEGYREEDPKELNFYNREVRSIMLEDGSEVKAYVYMYNDKGHGGLGEYIEEGDFRTWKQLQLSY